MSQFIYLIFMAFGVVIFIVGVIQIPEGNYDTAIIVGSIGIFLIIVFYDAFMKLSDIVGEEESVIYKARENLKKNEEIYIDALNTIESFKRKGIYGGYQTYDVYEREKYEKACSIVYDYEKNNKIIENIKMKRFIRDAKTIGSALIGLAIGKKLSSMGREKNDKK